MPKPAPELNYDSSSSEDVVNPFKYSTPNKLLSVPKRKTDRKDEKNENKNDNSQSCEIVDPTYFSSPCKMYLQFN